MIRKKLKPGKMLLKSGKVCGSGWEALSDSFSCSVCEHCFCLLWLWFDSKIQILFSDKWGKFGKKCGRNVGENKESLLLLMRGFERQHFLLSLWTLFLPLIAVIWPIKILILFHATERNLVKNGGKNKESLRRLIRGFERRHFLLSVSTAADYLDQLTKQLCER